MTMLDRIRNRSPDTPPSDDHSTQAGSPDGNKLPIPGYDQLDGKEVGARLPDLSQVELGAVEAYERSHGDRQEVLNKLRYMSSSEPLPGYDALTTEQIVEELAGADSGTVRAVRDYERKFKHRRPVLDEAARVLPASQASAQEGRAREEQSALVREGFAGREKTAGGLASGRSAAADRGG